MPDRLIYCPECNTKTTVPEQKLESSIKTHNNSLHDGNEVAGVGHDAVPLSEYNTENVDPLSVHCMEGDAGPPHDHPDGVRGICKDCTLVALFDSELDAWDAVEQHNTIAHNDNDVAGVCEWDVMDLPSFSELARKSGFGVALEVYGDLD